MLHLTSVLSFTRFFFAPHGQAWWAGAVWGNVVAVVPCGVLAFAWSKTKFWPLKPVRSSLARLHERHDAIHSELQHLRESHQELHAKLDSLKQAQPVPVAAVIPVRRARPPNPPIA